MAKKMKNKTLTGIYLLVSLLLLCVIPVIVFYSSLKEDIIRMVFFVGASGGIGGCLYSIRGFYQNIGGDTFDSKWVWWYIFRPIISVVVGVFSYFLIVGGLMSISFSSEVTFSKGIMFYCAVAFLAGFSFTHFADNLKDLSATLFSQNCQENQAGQDPAKSGTKNPGK
jgi:hypothetical protein